MGIIYDPFREEVFWAVKGAGKLPEWSAHTGIGGQTAFRYHHWPGDGEKRARGREFRAVSQGIRAEPGCPQDRFRGPGAGIHCLRQTGGYFEAYLNPWDYAAGMLLVQEAGGMVTDFAGNSLDPGKGSSIVGTNGAVHGELCSFFET